MEALNKWMRRKKVNQSALAELIGTDRHQVNRWIRGRKKPSLSTLQRLKDATGLTLEQLTK